jgi:outer membrane protein assembly factor BamB
MRRTMTVIFFSALALVGWQSLRIASVHAQSSANWLQWGRTAQHNGDSSAVGQSPQAQLADIPYDPFVAQEQAEQGGPLTAHYQAPLIDGGTAFLELKTGVYTPCNPPGSHTPYPCGPDAWNGEIWNERAFTWQSGSLAEKWNFESDWKPEPSSNLNDVNSKGFGLFGWEPVFHAAISRGHVFVPGASGSVYKLNEVDGSVAAHITPFAADPNTYVSGPLTADAGGNIYYNALRLDPIRPWTVDPTGAWLVKIAPDGGFRVAKYETLVPGAQVSCLGIPCGSQRGSINLAPAISPDGKTLYTVSIAHFIPYASYLVAVNVSDLMPKWHVSFNKLLGPNTVGFASDLASSTPAVAPDGSIFFGVLSFSPTGRGVMMKFSPEGQYLAAFNFGWDETPAIYPHDGTYSLIIKNNYYLTSGPYFITQLDSNLRPEWHFKNNTIDATHPNGYEWCVNAPAVDANGTVYANSEDGNVYVINQGGTLKGKIFELLAIQAAYTPIAIGPDGRLYTENDGDMVVVGEK